jgi:RND family efflux transporter MFP subunit
MQTLALLWFELQVAQQSLRESFAAGQRAANAANVDAPSSMVRRRAASEKQLPRIESADALKRHIGRKPMFRLIRTSVYLAIGAIIYAGTPAQLAADAQPMLVNPVSVVHPEKAGTASLQLPGQLWAYTDAPIYAQTSGYLRSWAFDIGAKVKANDILGEIDTPEVDQSLAQAKAQLQVDQSALGLAQVTYRRYQPLFVQLVLDAQTRDTAADTYREDDAKVTAEKANIERLNALEAFKLLRAPFDGIVTARDVDIGAYVANGSGHELFRVARTSPLRIYVNVPQRDAQLVKIGMEGDLTLPQFPNRVFRAHVTNTAEVVHPTSRSLLTELQIPNESGDLLPGAYAEITLKFTDDSRFLTIPDSLSASLPSAFTHAINGPQRCNSAPTKRRG